MCSDWFVWYDMLMSAKAARMHFVCFWNCVMACVRSPDAHVALGRAGLMLVLLLVRTFLMCVGVLLRFMHFVTSVPWMAYVLCFLCCCRCYCCVPAAESRRRP